MKPNRARLHSSSVVEGLEILDVTIGVTLTVTFGSAEEMAYMLK